MNKTDFFKELNVELDLGEKELNENSELHLTSLMQLSLISFLDHQFKVRVKAADLKEIDSVEKLMTLIGVDKFK